MFLFVKDLQSDIQNHSTSFATAVKDIEGFLEENQTKLSPQELTALREKLHQAKEQYEVLQERTRVAQKELEEAVTSALQQETEKVADLLVFQSHIGAESQKRSLGASLRVGLFIPKNIQEFRSRVVGKMYILPKTN